jgi:integrase
MTRKLNTKIYEGDRVRIPVPSSLNIRRIYVWSKLLKKYVDPPRGGKYEARRSKGKNEDRETRNFDSLQDARDWQTGRNFKSGNEFNLANGQNPEGYLVEHLLSDWQRLRWPRLRENTKIFYSNLISQFEPLFGVEVEKISPRIIDEWISILKSPDRLKQYLGTKTSLEKEVDLFKAMLNWYIQTNDDTKLVSPFKARHKDMLFIKERKVQSVKYMKTDELEKWLKILKGYSPLFWALALTQQKQVLRISEAAAMKWSNVDLNSRSYRVTEHLTWPRVNGRPPELVPGTKTNKSGQAFNIFLRQEVVEALRDLEPHRRGDLIFSHDGSLLTYRQIQHAYNWAFKKAGLPHRSTHILRHTGATEFLQETGDPLALQQMGNWANQKMALHYGQILATRAKDAILSSENRQRKLRLAP